MNDIAISVKNISKSYRMYPSPKEKLKELLHPFGKKYHKEFWALRDVSLDVKKGECIGIIGRNGSGKSTLLQIICGVLQSTSGEAKVSGRISALLELGAGFNREFSGRENVHMNGALMGLPKEEMDEKFQAIADFADIGQFIEQPVKTYSSGMYVRLAFACAVNVDPDILIVDEALSVGDEAFQRKCYARITNFKERGKTILFVSHSAAAIVQLCDRAVLFERGQLLLEGTPKLVVSKYQQLIYAPAEKAKELRQEIIALNNSSAKSVDNVRDNAKEQDKAAPNRNDKSSLHAYYDPHLKSQSTIEYESRGVRIKDPHITTLDGKKVNALVRGVEYIYTYSLHFEKAAYNVRAGMMIKTIRGLELGGIGNPTDNGIEHIKEGAVLQVKIRFRCSLLPGVYFMNAGIFGTVNGNEIFLHRIVDVIMFRVQPEKSIFVSGTIDFSSTEVAPPIEMRMHDNVDQKLLKKT